MKKVLFLIAMIVAFVGTNAQNNQYDENWSQYVIAQRTSADPKVHKSYYVGNLNATKINLALATPYVDTDIKVYDVAELLLPTERMKLQNRVKLFVKTNDVDMVIVTINRNNKEDNISNNASENFAIDFYEYNDFGKGNHIFSGYDGVILLIDMQNRKFVILDSGRPNEVYVIAKTNLDKYLQDMATDLTNKNYFKAISYFIDEYESDYQKAKSSVISETDFPNYPKILGRWGAGVNQSEIIYQFYRFGVIKNEGESQRTKFNSWRLKDNNTVEFEVKNGDMSFWMPWSIVELTDDKLILSSGQTQIEFGRL